MKRIYLDYAATTPTAPEVVKAMLPYFSEQFGNPSSIHSFGQEAEAAVEDARETVAGLLGARPEEIVFTSGGTESNNLTIKGIAFADRQKGRHIITSAIEHHAVLEPCRFLEQQGFDVTYLPVDRFGLVSPDDVRQAITNQTILISIMHANNEIGTIEPIAEIGALAGEQGIYLHTDAVQSFGQIPLKVDTLQVDLLSVSAHKLYGPKGIGALYVRKGTSMEALLHGGEQERKRRASTENVPAIVGFGKAVALAKMRMPEERSRLTGLRDAYITRFIGTLDRSHLNGHSTQRLPNNINITIEGVDGESLLLNLDMEAVAASSGAACNSSSLSPSHVLLALGLSRQTALGSLRLTLGQSTTAEELDYVLEVLPKIVDRLRRTSRPSSKQH